MGGRQKLCSLDLPSMYMNCRICNGVEMLNNVGIMHVLSVVIDHMPVLLKTLDFRAELPYFSCCLFHSTSPHHYQTLTSGFRPRCWGGLRQWSGVCTWFIHRWLVPLTSSLDDTAVLFMYSVHVQYIHCRWHAFVCKKSGACTPLTCFGATIQGC